MDRWGRANGDNAEGVGIHGPKPLRLHFGAKNAFFRLILRSDF